MLRRACALTLARRSVQVQALALRPSSARATLAACYLRRRSGESWLGPAFQPFSIRQMARENLQSVVNEFDYSNKALSVEC